jgi:hypothetical protein
MPRDTLTKDQIVRTAIELLDDEGLEGLNMRSLGKRPSARAGFAGTEADRASAIVFTFVLGSTLGVSAMASLTRRLSRDDGDADERIRETMAKATEVASRTHQGMIRRSAQALAPVAVQPTSLADTDPRGHQLVRHETQPCDDRHGDDEAEKARHHDVDEEGGSDQTGYLENCPVHSATGLIVLLILFGRDYSDRKSCRHHGSRL